MDLGPDKLSGCSRHSCQVILKSFDAWQSYSPGLSGGTSSWCDRHLCQAISKSLDVWQRYSSDTKWSGDTEDERKDIQTVRFWNAALRGHNNFNVSYLTSRRTIWSWQDKEITSRKGRGLYHEICFIWICSNFISVHMIKVYLWKFNNHYVTLLTVTLMVDYLMIL
jgi:hypothetical protein